VPAHRSKGKSTNSHTTHSSISCVCVKDKSAHTYHTIPVTSSQSVQTHAYHQVFISVSVIQSRTDNSLSLPSKPPSTRLPSKSLHKQTYHFPEAHCSTQLSHNRINETRAARIVCANPKRMAPTVESMGSSLTEKIHTRL